MNSFFRSACLLLTLISLSSCIKYQSIKPDTIVVVKEIDLPASSARVAQFASHSYLEYREDVNAPWYRIEVEKPNSGVVIKKQPKGEVFLNNRMDENVRILSQTNGKGHPNLIRDIKRFSASYDDSVYRSYPGPNSNTFIEKMIREVDGLSANLDHNAIGKEYGYYIGKTDGGTGLEVQTPLAGVAVGLKEGVEVNALGLGAGVSIWPPSIRIPFLPRIPTWE